MPGRQTSSVYLPHSVPYSAVDVPVASAPAVVRDYGFEDVPALCAALRTGDDEAFRFLYGEWNQRILRYCYALAGGNDEAGVELAQAVYLRVL